MESHTPVYSTDNNMEWEKLASMLLPVWQESEETVSGSYRDDIDSLEISFIDGLSVLARCTLASHPKKSELWRNISNAACDATSCDVCMW